MQSSRSTRRTTILVAALVGIFLAGGRRADAQHPAKEPKPLPAPGLLLAPMAGQPIAVLPVTYLVSDSGVAGMPATRAEQLAWADSILADGLQTHGPEANWVWPAELRRIARRAPGMVADPDRMGQSVMRYSNLKQVPDPFLSNIRALVAMTNGRVVMIPAALRFTRSDAGVTVHVTLVLADARSGQIPWRSDPIATAPTAGAALAATIARILPDQQ